MTWNSAASGQPHITNFVVPLEALEWTGEEEPKAYAKAGGKTHRFCGTCGTRFGAQTDSIIVVGVATANGGDLDAIKPQFHIQTAEKPGWYELPDDGLPRFERWPVSG